MDKIDKLCAYFLINRSDLLDPRKPPFSSITVKIGHKTTGANELTPEEMSLLDAYRNASDRDKGIVDAVLRPKVHTDEKQA